MFLEKFMLRALYTVARGQITLVSDTTSRNITSVA